MTQAEFIALVEETLEADAGSVTLEQNLEDLGWSSLATMTFMALVDEACDHVVSPKAIAAAVTVKDLLPLMGNHVSD